VTRVLILALVLLVPCGAWAAQTAATAPPSGDDSFLTGIRAAITKHLGKPYVWGATGIKSFDCSGFIWRVMFENGILVKRTTARKFYMMLPKVQDEERYRFGTVVFFDNLKHVGIVDSPETFYHAQVSRGTNLSPFNAYWRKRLYGFRALPVPAGD
jgi:peptidoglycan endopeptidase LytE